MSLDADSVQMMCIDDDFDRHAEEINEYYTYLESNDFLELNWTLNFPGRRPPQKPEEATRTEAPLKDQSSKKSSNKDFDFDEGESEPSTTKFGSRQTPKTLSSKKKTTFSAVMDKMKKQHATPK